MSANTPQEIRSGWPYAPGHRIPRKLKKRVLARFNSGLPYYRKARLVCLSPGFSARLVMP
jgi:hypothetical protein